MTPAEEEHVSERAELLSLLHGIQEILLTRTRRIDRTSFQIPTPLLLQITDGVKRALAHYDTKQ